jgi:hypothetical protein
VRKLILAAVAAATLTVGAVAPAIASADAPHVNKCGITMAKFTATNATGQQWVHNYTVALNTCDGDFAGAGVATYQGHNVSELISGHSAGDTISFTVHQPFVVINGVHFTWSLTNAPTNGTTVSLDTRSDSNPSDGITVSPLTIVQHSDLDYGAP